MLTPKYKLNQKVWAVTSHYNTHIEHEKCDLCNSTGVVEINGDSYECPKCNGRTKTVNDGFKYLISTSGKIGKINIEEYAKKYRTEKSRITYMLDSTGVGSGTIWYETRLFPTEQAAKEFCETRNPIDYYDTGKEIFE